MNTKIMLDTLDYWLNLHPNEVRPSLLWDLRAIRDFISEASKWVRTDDRKPEDGQRVLGCWRLPPLYRREKFVYGSLTYGAADSPIDGPEVWSHWDGEKADEPDYWMPLPEPPK